MCQIVAKNCSRCQEFKTASAFAIDNKREDGLTTQCKICRNTVQRASRKVMKKQLAKEGKLEEYNRQRVEAHRLSKYKNYTPGLFDELYFKQEGRCLICGRHQSELKNSLGIDHNHDNDEIRGLLCRRCNSGIMLFSEDAELCLRAYQYLRSS